MRHCWSLSSFLRSSLKSNSANSTIPNSPRTRAILKQERPLCSRGTCSSLVSPSKAATDGMSVSSSCPPWTVSEKPSENKLETPWFSIRSCDSSQQQKEVSRRRKEKWILKPTQVHRFDRLIQMCSEKLGPKATVQVFGRFGREIGTREYNALVNVCTEKARTSDDERAALQHISKAFQMLKAMKTLGFQLEEETYGPLFLHLIDKSMVDEFHYLYELIEDSNNCSLCARLGYYEMLFYVRVGNKEKIQYLCNNISSGQAGKVINLQESYVRALCEGDQKDELLQVLEAVDVTKLPLFGTVVCIFESLGRLFLESFAEKLLLKLKKSDYGSDNLSTLIYSFATSIKNVMVEIVVLKFKSLHDVLEMAPTLMSYEKLMAYSCDSLKVCVALDVADQMFKAGFTLSLGTLDCLLNACEECFEFSQVWRIYSLICLHDLKPNSDVFRRMICLSVKMKDFDGAYRLLFDLKKFNLVPTTSMFNAIMIAYFREKNIYGGLLVVKQMKLADVELDSQTYSYLIGNCANERQIDKYFKESSLAGIQPTKQIYMQLINAYVNCGNHAKAKKILLEEGIPRENINEIKSVLVYSLASNGQMSHAFRIYDEMRDAGSKLDPKAVIALIEHVQCRGELSKLLKLLGELDEQEYWVDGCCRVIRYCVRHKHLWSAVDLLKQLREKLRRDERKMERHFDEACVRSLSLSFLFMPAILIDLEGEAENLRR